MVIFHGYVSLPEGKMSYTAKKSLPKIQADAPAMAPSGHCHWGLARAPPDWNWFTWSYARKTIYYLLKLIKETKNFDS